MGNADTQSPERTDEATGDAGAVDGWSAGNWLLIGVLTGLTLVGIGLSAGLVPVDGWLTAPGGAVVVPPYVYLYASLGALGYVFTKLMTNVEAYDEYSEIEELAEMALRMPAAWVLAAGVYLLFAAGAAFTNGGSGQQYAAGLAFLVGLYVNVAVKSLGSLADRLLGRSSADS
ncbi:hypothetical protein [Halorientalis sp.]|jgi:hypothetical protein|uniref:hypothetical protein n=1 Tax=Halorientalis sp. TaxID=1931229 RepID=UPI00261FDEE3|nr:hypothetical protein [Halorientalis sp.]